MKINNQYRFNEKKDYNSFLTKLRASSQNFPGWLSYFAPNDDFKMPNIDTNELPIKLSHAIDYWNINGGLIIRNNSFKYNLYNRESVQIKSLSMNWNEREVLSLLNLSIGNGMRSKKYKDTTIHLKNYPSGGAMYPIKLYIIFNQNIGNFKKGRAYKIYSEFGKISIINTRKFLFKDLFAIGQFNKRLSNDIKSVNFSIIMTMNLSTSFTKYKDFSEKLSYIECGHIGQNLQLSATALNKKSQPSGGVLNDKVKTVLNLSDDEFVIYGVFF